MTAVEERIPAPGAKIAGLLGWLERREVQVVAVAAGLAFVASAVLAVHAGTTLNTADEQQYYAIAGNLAHHGRYSIDGVTPTAYRPPVWPLVLAAVRLVGGGVVAARLVNAVFLAAAVVGVWRVARRLGGPAAGVVGAVACAVYPLFLYTAATLFPQTLGTALVTATILASMNVVDAVQADDRRRALKLAALTGLLASLLVLAIPVFSGPMVLIVLWFAIALRRKALPLLGVLVGTALLLPLAWTIRNEASMHAVIPVSTSDGVNLLLGNSEHAGPGTGTLVDISGYVATVKQRGLDETAQDTYYRESALTWIEKNPGKAVVLFTEKTVNYFNFRDRLASGGEPSAAQSAVLATAYLPVFGLVLVRLARSRRHRLSRDEALTAGLFLISSLFMAVFFTRVRFRLPLDAPAIALAAATAVTLLTQWKDSRVRTGLDQA